MADLNVECKECQTDLNAQWRVLYGETPYLSVEVCPMCRKDARQEGYDERRAEEE